MSKLNLKLLWATALFFTLINTFEIPQLNSRWGISLNSSQEALARSSGGRSSGGSFRSSPSRSSSSSPSRSSSGSSSSSSSSSSSRSSSGSSSSSTKPAARSTSTTNPSRSSTGTTGGRASGGSFQKPTTPTSPVPTNANTNPTQPSYPSTPSRSSVRPSYPVNIHRSVELEIELDDDDDDFRPNQTVPYPATRGSTTTVAPNPAGSVPQTTVPSSSVGGATVNSQDSTNTWLVFLVVIMMGVGMFLSVYLLLKLVFFLLNRQKAGSATSELENDIVTVSKLQVALYAHTKGLQSELSELTLRVDTDTRDGLLELLQDSALVLLRNSENWSHVLASSQTVNIDQAESIFTQLSVQERSKFSTETLSNIRGKVTQKVATIPGLEEDPGAYIVVTLLVGTADDQPLFKDVRSIETLRKALQTVASVRSDYLMKVELLWSPQFEEDSLTYDELLTEYTDMIQIA